MVTVLREVVYDQIIHDVRCLSTDTKPTTGIKNGSTCLEMDTGSMYMYDAENAEWHQM